MLLGKLEAQGRELAGLQHHQTQARQLTATLHSTTDALEKSQGELQHTASVLASTQQQLAQVCTAVHCSLVWLICGESAALLLPTGWSHAHLLVAMR